MKNLFKLFFGFGFILNFTFSGFIHDKFENNIEEIRNVENILIDYTYRKLDTGKIDYLLNKYEKILDAIGERTTGWWGVLRELIEEQIGLIASEEENGGLIEISEKETKYFEGYGTGEYFMSGAWIVEGENENGTFGKALLGNDGNVLYNKRFLNRELYYSKHKYSYSDIQLFGEDKIIWINDDSDQNSGIIYSLLGTTEEDYNCIHITDLQFNKLYGNKILGYFNNLLTNSLSIIEKTKIGAVYPKAYTYDLDLKKLDTRNINGDYSNNLELEDFNLLTKSYKIYYGKRIDYYNLIDKNGKILYPIWFSDYEEKEDGNYCLYFEGHEDHKYCTE